LACSAPRTQLWTVFLAALVIISTATVPLQLCFSDFGDDDSFKGAGWDVLALMMDICFCLDVPVQARTAFFNKDGVYVKKPPAILRRYLRTWFVIDVLAALPLGRIVSDIQYPATLRANNLLRLFRFIGTFRLVKAAFALVKVRRLLQQLEGSLNLSPGTYRFAGVFTVFVVFCHCMRHVRHTRIASCAPSNQQHGALGATGLGHSIRFAEWLCGLTERRSVLVEQRGRCQLTAVRAYGRDRFVRRVRSQGRDACGSLSPRSRSSMKASRPLPTDGSRPSTF
jgi:hypothetical protein